MDISHEVSFETNAKTIECMFMSYLYRDGLIKKKSCKWQQQILYLGNTTHKDGEGSIQMYVSV